MPDNEQHGQHAHRHEEHERNIHGAKSFAYKYYTNQNPSFWINFLKKKILPLAFIAEIARKKLSNIRAQRIY